MFDRLRFKIRNRFRPTSPNIRGKSIIIDTKLGDFSYIGPECRIFQADIAPFVSIGPRVIIGESEHILDFDFLSNSLLNLEEKNVYLSGISQRTVLESDCWIGAQVVIRKGVRIGRGAVVGAGAVVVKSVPPYSVYAGVPAAFLKMRFDEKRIKKLEDSRWWEEAPVSLVRRVGYS